MPPKETALPHRSKPKPTNDSAHNNEGDKLPDVRGREQGKRPPNTSENRRSGKSIYGREPPKKPSGQRQSHGTAVQKKTRPEPTSLPQAQDTAAQQSPDRRLPRVKIRHRRVSGLPRRQSSFLMHPKLKRHMMRPRTSRRRRRRARTITLARRKTMVRALRDDEHQ